MALNDDSAVTPDDDNIQGVHLTPIQQRVLDKARVTCLNERCPVSFKDFRDFNHGTLRNCFHDLRKMGLMEPYDEVRTGFQWVTAVPRPATAVTRAPMVGRDLLDLLRGIKMGARAIHDVRLLLYKEGVYAASNHPPYEVMRSSLDLRLPAVTSGLRSTRVFVHRPDKVSVMVGSSMDPFPLTVPGYGELNALLGGVKMKVETLCEPRMSLPPVSMWLVTQWHYGRDGENEVGGPRFNVTVGLFGHTMARAYTKELAGKPTLRVEVLDSPNGPLAEAILGRLGVGGGGSM